MTRYMRVIESKLIQMGTIVKKKNINYITITLWYAVKSYSYY